MNDTRLISESSRSLRQEELDGLNRAEFTSQILTAIGFGDSTTAREIRFLAVKKHYSLITIRKVTSGEFEFSCADQHFFTYRLTKLIDFIEKPPTVADP